MSTFTILGFLELGEKFSVVGGGGGGWSKVTLVFSFGPKLTFCSFDLDLDQAEQYLPAISIHHQECACT